MTENEQDLPQGPMFLTRPRSAEIYNYLVDAERPLTIAEIARNLDMIYNTARYHVKLMEQEQYLIPVKLNSKNKKEIYYRPVSSTKVVTKPKVTGHLLRPYWEPAGRSMTITEIIRFNKENNPDMGQIVRRIYGFLIHDHVIDVLRLADNPLLREDPKLKKTFEFRRTEMQKVISIARGVLKTLESLSTEEAIKLYDPEHAVRVLIDEDTEFNINLMKEFLLVDSSYWSQEQLQSMSEKPLSWLLGLFHANWNTPVMLEDVCNILPGCNKSQIQHLLFTYEYKDTGAKLFEKIKGARAIKWHMDPAEHWEFDSREKARLIAESKLIEDIFNIQPRNLDINPLNS